ncbi:MarR family transcriptional regulator [Amphritea atlantica]|uniref:MarR family transcriptional regulator n=1 Tax=Amphritea atlantica TaxID=355243 RepID=A0ABY5GQN9_9GAMM|nr:MarR family transcriptional regulator [Amphritea atlantica]
MANQNSSEDIDYGILDTLVGYKLRRAQVNLFNHFSEHCSRFGITPGLFGVLSIVERNPGLTQTAIANALGNDRSAMVSVVDRLEAMNVVERKPSTSDRRSHALFLTKHGEAFYAELVEEVLKHEANFTSLLNEGEKALIIDILDRFAAHAPSKA